jgi:hypothetical protein
MKQLITFIATLLTTLATGQAMATPMLVASYSEYPGSGGTAIGTGKGDLVDGVLTYEMEYVLDLVIFDPTTLSISGTIYDDILPPYGNSIISACVGESAICDNVELNTLRDESFLTGGPLSETEVTILTTGPSPSGRTPPSTLTITPVALVPLPATAWLISPALIVMAGIRRKR